MGDAQVSRLRLAFTKPEELKRRAAVRTSDGHRMELIGTWKKQIEWFMKALRHAHVKHLVIGCTGGKPVEEVTVSKNIAKLIATHAPTICVDILELGAVNMHKMSPKLFASMLLSFQSLSTLTTKDNYCPGGHFTDDFLRRAGQMGVKFTHVLNARVPLFSICTYVITLSVADELYVNITDEGVLDYLFNPTYAIRSRFLQIRFFRPSTKFLFKLFEAIGVTV
ncbi:hypothetical protein AAVH_13855 [Aphelenchoides avenae]|nr:hypothetical protein AAVH_13855 [Aphelenchus avenae]